MAAASDSEGVQALRRHLSDLTTLLALLPLWHRGASDEIAASLLDVLVTLLRLDYAYIRLPDPADGPPVEVWRPLDSRPPDAVVHILHRSTLSGDPDTFTAHSVPIGLLPRSTVGSATRVVSTHLQLIGESSFVLTAARRSRFPTSHERLLLNLAIEQADVAISTARLINQEAAARSAAEAAVQSRDALLAMMSHDLKNPLTAISASTQFLLRHAGRYPMDSADTARISAIVAQADRMYRLIDELLDVSRLPMGAERALRVSDVDLVALAQRIIQSHRVSGQGRSLVFAADSDHLVGRWDSTRLEQVLDNLLGNAVKYSPEGSTITVTVRVEQDPSGRRAVLAVRDEGIGIPAADLPQVFERFHRGTNVVEQVPGTGIGLASVQELVQLHGGTVSVESGEGAGSTFTVQLPLSPPTTRNRDIALTSPSSHGSKPQTIAH